MLGVLVHNNRIVGSSILFILEYKGYQYITYTVGLQSSEVWLVSMY
jgi:hypothetical protein